MSNNNQSIKTIWQSYINSIGETLEETTLTYEAWAFGLGKEMADDLAGLVLLGKKTATASLHYLYEAEGESLPAIGDHSIILDGDGEACCIIKTTDVTLVPYNEVDETFARKEGEGDLSLNYWREGHRKFFTEELKAYGRNFEEDMLVVCETFEVVYK